MTNLLTFHVTDGIDDLLAADHNRLVDSTVRGEMSNTETLTANKTLENVDFPLQVFAPTAARNVTLPAVAAANHPYFIVNTSGSYALTVKNAGGTTIKTIAASGSAILVSNGLAWYAFG